MSDTDKAVTDAVEASKRAAAAQAEQQRKTFDAMAKHAAKARGGETGGN